MNSEATLTDVDPTKSEENLLDKLEKVQAMNQNGYHSDDYTKNVSSLKIDGSLDFGKYGIPKSKRIEKLKEMYKGTMPKKMDMMS